MLGKVTARMNLMALFPALVTAGVALFHCKATVSAAQCGGI